VAKETGISDQSIPERMIPTMSHKPNKTASTKTPATSHWSTTTSLATVMMMEQASMIAEMMTAKSSGC